MGAVFSELKFEEFANLGNMGEVLESTNPWAKLLWSDLQALGKLDDCSDFVRAIGSKLFRLFVPGPIQTAFQNSDFKLLRVKAQTVCIPPPPGFPPPISAPTPLPPLATHNAHIDRGRAHVHHSHLSFCLNEFRHLGPIRWHSHSHPSHDADGRDGIHDADGRAYDYGGGGNIPPDDGNDGSDANDFDELCPYICCEILTNGNPCRAKFSTLQRLAAHQSASICDHGKCQAKLQALA